MQKYTYEEKLAVINYIVEIVNKHWHRLQGELHDDKQFWEETLHSISNEEWEMWVDIFPAIKAQYPDEVSKFPYCEGSVYEIEKLIHKNGYSKPIVKKNVPHQNKRAFLALMNMKDVINEINGRPTKKYPKKQENKQEHQIQNNKIAIFKTLFEIKQS